MFIGIANRLGGLNSSGPALGLNFLGETADSRVTFSGGTNGTRTNSAGVLVAATTPRIDYDPVTLEPLGLLDEEQRTNNIRNNTMVGAVVGLPGTVPVNWAIANPSAGLTREIVATSTEAGIFYTDVRFSGVASSTNFAIAFETTMAVAATVGQPWSESVYIKYVDATLPPLSIRIRMSERDGGGANLGSNDSAALPITTSLTRFASMATLSQPTVAFVYPQLTTALTNGNSYDFTIRIGMPQLEMGPDTTSVIPTSTVAVTRTADVADMTGTNFSDWYNQSEGTIVVEWSVNSTISMGNRRIFAITNGSSNERIVAGVAAASNIPNYFVVDGGVTQASFNGSIVTEGAAHTIAAAYKANDFAWSVDGGTVGTDASGTIPTVDRLQIGNQAGTEQINGHIRSITYYRNRLPNAQLEALAA